MVTHVLDTSAALAGILAEPGAERVRTVLKDPSESVGVSVLTLYGVYTTVLHRTGSERSASATVADLRKAVSRVIPVTEDILAQAFDLRRAATARIALADLLIAVTAAYHEAVLVHRDPHFSALPAERPAQEILPGKV